MIRALKSYARSRQFLFILGFLVLVGALRVGYAQSAASDPVTTATSTASTGMALIQQYGPIWGAMLMIFGVASNLLAQLESKPWFAKGRRLAIAVAAIGVFGAILKTHFGDGQWAGVITTAVLAIFKVLDPTVAPSPAPVKASGFITTRLMVILAVFGLVGGGLALESCTKTEATLKDTGICAESALAKDIQPMIAAALQTTGTMAQKLLAALETALGPDLVDCVVKAVKADILAKQGAPMDAKEAAKRATMMQNADAWLNRKKSSALEHDIPRGSPAVACVAGWIPEGERNGRPVCPPAMSREASAR